MPEPIEFGPAVAEFVSVIAKKVKPRSIEIGYEPEPNGEDPLPGDPATWYVEVQLSPLLKVRKRARGIGPETVLEALAAAAEALGITVRLRYADRKRGRA